MHSDLSIIKSLIKQDPLFVFALESEAKEFFNHLNLLLVGVGKVNAAYHLTRQICKQRPGIIINLGSAGSNSFKTESLVCCHQFVQRDIDVTPLGFAKYETPYSDQPIILDNGLNIGNLPLGICGTGDNFETTHQQNIYNVIDMEAFSLASIARKENIPFLSIKYISDGADGNAAEDWSKMVHLAGQALRTVVDELFED
ncbi:5'-methylthioadenosine/S-adenosylhomocysteine nucleosidase family protein [Polluticaenibacter yanchengensis]|uniref:Nucleoside phosphorylase domain-containing protein n=1 Tax=Polluticaenibacter yanchengensis TaxID=3014562 RepID=A0ABT4UI96_9BACT|nr:hypothetical protein [Chitinophagaceae bacterium LY-5]